MSEQILFLCCWLIDSACVGLRGKMPNPEQWNRLRNSVSNLVETLNLAQPDDPRRPAQKAPNPEMEIVPLADPRVQQFYEEHPGARELGDDECPGNPDPPAEA